MLGFGSVVLALLVVMLAAPSEAAVSRSVTLTIPTAGKVGATIAVKGKLTRSPRGSLVRIRRKTPSGWVTVASTRTSNARGAFAGTVRLPSAAGLQTYTAYAPRAGKRRAATSPVRRITVVAAPAPAPSPPASGAAPGATNLRVRSSSTQVALSWTNPTGTTAVRVRRAAGPNPPASPSDGTAVPTDPVASSAVDTVTQNQHYSYSVFTTTPLGTSGPTSAPRPGPSKPTDPTFGTTPGKAIFGWTNPVGTDRVVVDFSPTGGVRSQTPGHVDGEDIGLAETYTVGHLEPRSFVALTIYALDAEDNYLDGLTIQGSTGDGTDTTPDPVSGASATASPRSVAIAWTTPYQGVVVARGEGSSAPTSPDAGYFVGRSDGSSRIINDVDAQPGRTYTYGLWAVTSSGDYSSPVSVTVTTPAGAPPGPVTGLAATALPSDPDSLTDQKVRLSWTSPAQASSVLISRVRGAQAPATPSVAGGWSVPLPTNFLVDNYLAPGTTYTYAMWAVGSDGTYSPLRSVTVTTAQNARTLAGVVRNSVTGQPVGSVHLTLSKLGKVEVVTAVAGADGGYSTSLTVGTYSVCAEATPTTGGGGAYGYVRTCTTLRVGPTAPATYDVAVDPAAAIAGTITDAATHGPLAGVQVQIPSSQPFHAPIATAVTAADGTYLLAGMPAGPDKAYKVYVTDANGAGGSGYGYEPDDVTVPTTTVGGTVQQDFALAPIPEVRITGRVTSAADNAGVGGVGVYLVGAGSVRPLRGATVSTAPDGTYTATGGLTSGDTFAVCFDAEHYQDRHLATGFTNQCFGGSDFDPEDWIGPQTATQLSASRSVDIALASTSTVTVTVVDGGGAPLGGADVSVIVRGRTSRFVAETSTDGSAVLHTPLRSTGDGSVSICADGRVATGGTSTGGYNALPCIGATIDTGHPAAAPTFILSPRTTVLGKVVDSVSGARVADAWVELKSGQEVVGSGSTTSEGNFVLRQVTVQGGGPYSLCAHQQSAHVDRCVDLSTLGVPALTAGTTARLADLAIDPYGSVSGTVTDSSTGQPVAEVTVLRAGGTQVTSDANGRFEFLQVAPGAQTVSTRRTAAGSFGFFASDATQVVVAPGQQATANLTVSPAAAVRVKVMTPDGRPARGAEVRFVYPDSLPDQRLTADDGGIVLVRGLDATTYPRFDTVCAKRDLPGTGAPERYIEACGTLPMLRVNRAVDTAVVVGDASTLEAAVYDATTGKPIASWNSVIFAWNRYDETNQTYTGSLDDDGLALFEQRFADPRYPSAPGQPSPRFTSVRVCVNAPGYVSQCFGEGAAGPAGQELTAVPGFTVRPTFLLTPTS